MVHDVPIIPIQQIIVKKFFFKKKNTCQLLVPIMHAEKFDLELKAFRKQNQLNCVGSKILEKSKYLVYIRIIFFYQLFIIFLKSIVLYQLISFFLLVRLTCNVATCKLSKYLKTKIKIKINASTALIQYKIHDVMASCSRNVF